MYRYLFLLLCGLSLLTTACEPDEPDDVNQEELITTLTYRLTPDDGGDAVVFSFQDLDGDEGGMAPVVSVQPLTANTQYTGTLTLLNEAEDPAENITEEVLEEGVDHQVFYQSGISGLVVEYADTDDGGDPIGLETTLTTGAAGSGNLTITLRHEPIKDATDVDKGVITNAGGETDIQVTFVVDVE